MAPKQYETIADAAARYGVCARTIRRRISEGAITAYRVGPHLIRLDPVEVDAALLRPVPTVAFKGERGPEVVSLPPGGRLAR